MKIGVILDHWQPAKGGAERAVAHLVEAAAAAGHAVRVYCLDAAPDAPGAAVRVPVGRLARGRLERAFADAALDAAARDGVDVTLGVRHLPRVDVYWPHGGLHRATLAAGEASKGHVTRAVSSLLHRLSPRHRTFLDLEAQLLADGGARRVWCVSDLVRRELASAFPDCAGRLELHANGVDLDRFHPGLRDQHRQAVRTRLGVPEHHAVLLFLGGNWRLKGLPVLLDALAASTALPWTCLIVGPHAARVTRGVPAGRVRALPPGDVRPLYGAADLLVQPTWRDPCSLATLEALACGVPVVTTTANGAAEAIVPRAGAVIEPGDADALARRLTELVPRSLDVVERAAVSGAARSAVGRRGRSAWTGALLRSLESAAR